MSSKTRAKGKKSTGGAVSASECARAFNSFCLRSQEAFDALLMKNACDLYPELRDLMVHDPSTGQYSTLCGNGWHVGDKFYLDDPSIGQGLPE